MLKGNIKKDEYDKLPQELRSHALSTKTIESVKATLSLLQRQLAKYSGGTLKKLAEEVVAHEAKLKINFRAGASTLVQRAHYIKSANAAKIVDGLPDVGRSGLNLSWAFARFMFYFDSLDQ